MTYVRQGARMILQNICESVRFYDMYKLKPLG